MRKLAVAAIVVLGYGAFYASNSYSEDTSCAIIKDDDDVRDVGLKYLEANPQLWRDYYSTTAEMRRSATYGRMGMPGRMTSVTLIGLKQSWTYQLNLECTSNGNMRFCKHVIVGFDSCGR